MASSSRQHKVAASFAADVDAKTAQFYGRFAGAVGRHCAWRTISEPLEVKAKLYLIATDDRMIPPAAQQFMSKRAGSTCRGQGQSCGLRLATVGRGRDHREGCTSGDFSQCAAEVAVK